MSSLREHLWFHSAFMSLHRDQRDRDIFAASPLVDESASSGDIQRLRTRDQSILIHSLHSQSLQKSAHVWVRGQGAVLVDQDGKEYLDAISGLWNVILGHGRRELVDAAASQMSRLAYASGYTGSSNLPSIELGERLSELCYPSMGGFFFGTGGAEAVDAAVKTARWWWKLQSQGDKIAVIGRQYGYHGTGMVAMSATGLPAYWPMFEPRIPNFEIVESPYPYRFNTESHRRGKDDLRSPGIIAADLVEEAILRLGAGQVACVIAEPVQGAGGVIVPPDDYWPRLRAICTQHNVLLIADEIITGFGRTGDWFGLSRWNVEPDLICFAKGITNGSIPLSGVGFRRDIADAIRSAEGRQTWMHAATCSGHPVACAVALATLDVLQSEGLLERVISLGERLRSGLASLESLSHVGQTRGVGLMAAVELVSDRSSRAEYRPEERIGPRVHAAAQARGMFSRLRGDVFNLAPCYVSTESQIDSIVEILGESIREVTGD